MVKKKDPVVVVEPEVPETSSAEPVTVIEVRMPDPKMEKMKKLLIFLRDEVVAGNHKHVRAINEVLAD